LLKARSRKLSLVLILAMLMTMFAGLGTASAATTYEAVIVPTFGLGAGTDTYAIEIKVDQALSISVYDVVTISLPNAITIAGNNVDVRNTLDPSLDVCVVVPSELPGTNVKNAFDTNIGVNVGATKKSIDINFAKYTPTAGQGLMYVYINNAQRSSTTEDLVATIMGNSSAFPTGTVTIGKYISGAGTMATVKSVKSINTAGGEIDTITIVETKPNTWKNGDTIKLKLPAGFGWDGTPIVSGNWLLAGQNSLLGHFTVGVSSTDDRLLTITFNNLPTARTTTARIDLADKGGLPGGEPGLVKIKVTDDSVAKLGEISVRIYGDNTTDQDLVIAKMVDYNVTVEEDEIKEVVAGWDGTELGSFKIVEDLAGSLIPGREISLTLPEGVKWNTNAASGNWPNLGNTAPNVVKIENESGNVAFVTNNPTSATNNGRTLKFVLQNPAGGFTKSKIIFKKLQVSIRPDFKGDLEIEVGGNAGVQGTVKVAEVKPAVTLENDGKAKIIIGAQNQEVGDIIIKESVREAINTVKAGGTPHIKMTLPEGAKWAVKPTVEVTEGDISVDSVSTNGGELTINFKSTSSQPSTIKLSNVKITTNRVVPEGDIKVSISRDSAALTNNAAADKFDLTTITSVVIGQCVTPAPGAGAGEFKIGSNIYYVNGIAKVMDVAPYIKNDRTYVPMRYLGEMLGAEVVWDDAARTVTLTKADTTVVFTIGSTSYTVNGEAKTADVAPEITNDRTMLPARFVAEAFGAIVGWDPATQTVLIQQQ